MKINSKSTISSRMKLKKKNQSKEIKLEDEIFLKKKTRKMKSNLAGQS